jgi:hypothetical protein
MLKTDGTIRRNATQLMDEKPAIIGKVCLPICIPPFACFTQ